MTITDDRYRNDAAELDALDVQHCHRAQSSYLALTRKGKDAFRAWLKDFHAKLGETA